MSGTDQFPPRHLLPDDRNEERAGVEGNKQAQGQEKQQDEPALTSTQPLGLPAPPTTGSNEDSAADRRTLNVASGEEGGNKIALDELGPMVVNKDGTLSRIHNWDKMTDAERERTLRVLGKRNQSRMADLRG